MTKVLVRTENIISGDSAGSQGVMLEVWLYPISEDAMNAMLYEDYIKIYTDQDYRANDYLDLIADESLAYLVANYDSISWEADDLVLIGWNDLRYQGTNSYRLADDFISSRTGTGEIGQMGWYWNGYQISHQGSTAEHPGILRIKDDGGETILHPATTWQLNVIDELTFIFRPQATTNVNYRIGVDIDNTPNNATNTGFPLVMSGSTWHLHKKDTLGTTLTNTGITVATNEWYKFEAIRRNVSGYTTTWDFYVNRLQTGGAWSLTNQTMTLAGTEYMFPQFRVNETAGGDKPSLDVDYFMISCRDIDRVGTELPQVIAVVNDLYVGDTATLADIDVNIIKSTLSTTIDQDFPVPVEIDMTANAPSYTAQIAQAVANAVNTEASTNLTRFDILTPNWDVLSNINTNSVYLFDEFVSDQTDDNDIGSLGWEFGDIFHATNSSTLASVSDELHHPGILRMTTNTLVTSLTGSAIMFLSSEVFFPSFDTLTFVFRTGAATSNVQYTVGLQNVYKETYKLAVRLDPAQNNGKARFIKTDFNGTPYYDNASNLPFAANTWYKFSVTRLSNTSAQLTLCNASTSYTTVLTELNFSEDRMTPALKVSNTLSGDTAKTLDVDWFDIRMTPARG